MGWMVGLTRNSVAQFIQVATVDQVPAGERKLVWVDEEPAVLLNVEGEFFCIADVCSHDGGPLGEGELIDHQIECPRHGALFDIRTGEALTLPATAPTAVYHVRVEGDRILVAPA
jgi:3-phenylpropionate/trans-cinnamate dioxygenase ferredoxin subunit